MVANCLLENNIPVVSSEGLLLSSSSKVNFLICVLEYINDPYDYVARAAIVYYLNKNKLINDELHILNLQLKDSNEFRNILKKSKIIINEVITATSQSINTCFVTDISIPKIDGSFIIGFAESEFET